jgi:phage FluMu gp28-like protein
MPFQRRFVEDKSRFKIWLASRQIGKSFAVAMEVSVDCITNPGSTWVILSAGERQALEMMEKVKLCLKAWDMTLAWEGIERDGVTSELKCAEARLKNGSRVQVLPANPDTARGYSGHLVLDEFAFQRDPIGIWRAIYPSISNPLKGELKVRVLSTANGQSGRGSKFYNIWSDTDGDWSHHKTTVYDAKADGLNLDIDALRKNAGDSDTWRQEYECIFIDGGHVAFPYDFIAQCENAEASLIDVGSAPMGPRFVGIDIGTLHDPTVCITLERRNGLLYLVELLRIQGMALSDQDAILNPRIARAARASMDASGLGLDISQRMVRRHGGKVIAQPTTSSWKRKAFQSLIAGMEDRRLAIPADRTLRDDMHDYEVHGAGESAVYRAPHTEDGHSDSTSAIVHAWDAANQPDNFLPRNRPITRRFERAEARRRRIAA